MRTQRNDFGLVGLAVILVSVIQIKLGVVHWVGLPYGFRPWFWN